MVENRKFLIFLGSKLEPPILYFVKFSNLFYFCTKEIFSKFRIFVQYFHICGNRVNAIKPQNPLLWDISIYPSRDHKYDFKMNSSGAIVIIEGPRQSSDFSQFLKFNVLFENRPNELELSLCLATSYSTSGSAGDPKPKIRRSKIVFSP